VFVKVVVTPSSSDAELDVMARAIAEIDPKIPPIVQPATPRREGAACAARLLEIAARLERVLAEVRMIPDPSAYGALDFQPGSSRLRVAEAHTGTAVTGRVLSDRSGA
jgi:hypothetical protein